MTQPLTNAWQPDAATVASSNVNALMRRLNVRSYDDLYQYSIANPADYWKEILDFCGVAWRRPYAQFLDPSSRPEFPKWFVGGELNWVDSVLRWSSLPGTADQVAVVAEREDGSVASITYSELAERVSAFATGLNAHGVRRYDRIGLLIENGIEATVSLLAIAYCGAIVVPLFSGFGVDAIVSRLSACSARALIATTGFSRRGRWVDTGELIEEARGRLPTLELLIWKGARTIEPRDAHVDWLEIAAGARDRAQAVVMDPNDPFMIIYTSGTTGKPKGAVHTHGGFPLKIAHDSAVHFDVKSGDVFCWPADMGWIAGTLVMASALMRGATLVCYDGAPDFPDWSRMSRLIERHRITHFGSAPTLIRGLAANERIALQGDMSTLRLLITAGEGIDPEHFGWYQRSFGSGDCPVINYTGGTEVSGALVSSVVVKPIHPSAFNTASPGVEVDVLDAEGRALVDAVGELVVLKPFVGMTQSFWQDDDRYRKTYWCTIPGVWVHGDLALRKPGEGFYLLGRSDDTIKLAGKRLGPAEIEEVLLELPAIAEVAAIGVDDPVKGQKLVVFVVATPQCEQNDDELAQSIIAHVDLRLGKPFRPGRVHRVRQLPKTRSSKIMRRLIRSAYCNQPLGDLTALDNPASLDDIRQAMVGTDT